ncbi:MAG: hypothetical protein C4534_00445 [Gaiellales bacterium]|nr:MAG: hypothetical protein C4534_00445 [Gaiellales bacterium]
MGAILIALLVTAAGVAPLFTDDRGGPILDAGGGQEMTAPAAAPEVSEPAAEGTAPVTPAPEAQADPASADPAAAPAPAADNPAP